MPRARIQEFRVTAFKPLGDGPRRRSVFQEEKSITVYASGRGSSVKARAERALHRAMEILEPVGYDRFKIELTIGDEEKRLATIEKELEEKRQLLLEQENNDQHQ